MKCEEVERAMWCGSKLRRRKSSRGRRTRRRLAPDALLPKLEMSPSTTYEPLFDAPDDTDAEDGIQLDEMAPAASTSKGPRSPRHRAHPSTSSASKHSDDEDEEDTDHEVHGLMGGGKRRGEDETDGEGKDEDIEPPIFRGEESDFDSAYAMVRRVRSSSFWCPLGGGKRVG